jgi:RNA-directed DNA polymerase
MIAKANALASASSTYARSWDTIDWQTAKAHVRRLQMRIAKATREGRYGKIKSLQWLLTHSFYAKVISVKRVVQNRGGKTP